ncbi:TetR/AcrR family transcriptional regulator [Borborobacter arsenicus]|nr:TetR/AcrR family transcriptional regulator [Pseudaminobacter arsenicus]
MKTKRSDGIRAVAAELFAKHGYGAVGVADLGEAVGLGRGALYYHISSKEDLLYDISSHYVQLLIDDGRNIIARELDPVERIRLLSRAMIGAVYNHRAAMTVCFREIHGLSGDRYRNVNQLHQDYQQLWADTVSMGVAQGKFRSIEKVAIKGLMGMFFYSFLWLNPEGPQTADEIGDIFSDLILHALVPWEK